jgi:hypothetical protein
MTYKICYWDEVALCQKERDATPAEQAEIDARVANANVFLAETVRVERNAKLAASDWTQVADAPVDKAVWAAYRQALRDVTTQAGFPVTIDWPEAP